MKTPFFQSEERQKALIAACMAREGTPFREGLSKPGVGYDCAHFVRDCFAEAGVDTTPFDVCPRISLNAGRLSSTSILLDWVREIGRDRLALLDADAPLAAGDLLGIQERLSCNHLALAESPDWAWHVPFGGMVSRVPLSLFRNPRRNQIKAVFRLTEGTDV